jgi:hypothetical protein
MRIHMKKNSSSCRIEKIQEEQNLRQERNNLKVHAWGDVQKVRYHDSCCCFVYFQYADFFCLHMPLASKLLSSWTKKRTQLEKSKNTSLIWCSKSMSPCNMLLFCFRSLCFPPPVASMDSDEVIHSAPWHPGMTSSSVPAALLQHCLIFSNDFKCFQLMNWFFFPTICQIFPRPPQFFPDPLNFSCANSMFKWHKHHTHVVPSMQCMATQH